MNPGMPETAAGAYAWGRTAGSLFNADKGYVQRRPESTVLHRVVVNNLETFLNNARMQDPSGRGISPFVEDEFRKFINCGLLAGGFARIRCSGCGFERLVPFSCKARGICPSCAGRRMSEKAAHMADSVFPDVPVRQIVLSMPFRLRYVLAWDHELTLKILKVFYRVLNRSYVNRAKELGIKNPLTGAVTVIQRVGAP